MLVRLRLLGDIFCKLNQYRSYSQKFRRIYDMSVHKVLVTHESGTETVGLSFRYKNEALKIDRIFNFERSTKEGLSNILTRIGSNIQKAASKKKRKNETPVGEVYVRMMEEDESLVKDDLPCYETFVASAGKHKLVIGDTSYEIDLNPPTVMCVDLPKNMMAGFPVYPSKFEVRFAEKKQCLFKWYKSDLKFETEKKALAELNRIKWVESGFGVSCKTTSEDVGRLLKVVVTPWMEDRRGEDVEVTSTVLVSAGPGECPFERRHHFTKTVCGENSLRVISYNILADCYADSDFARSKLFPTCPSYAIEMDYRKQLLVKEILGYNGDLICLQEVDEKVFHRDLLPALNHEGLDGFYDAKGGHVTEGLAVFFRLSKLRILDHSRLVLGEELQHNILFADMWEKVQTNPELTERIVQRSTVLQVNVFESVEDPSKLLVVGVTHLYFHPDADHIRLLQAGISLQILQQVVGLFQSKHPEKEVALLFCGDFNSTPEFGVYRLMTTQFIDLDDIDWSSKACECVKGIHLSHNLELDSACGCPPYTNFTTGFYGCLDYIFYQSDKLSVKQVIPMPAHEEVTQHVALPSITFPSDHIPLIADLQFIMTGTSH